MSLYSPITTSHSVDVLNPGVGRKEPRHRGTLQAAKCLNLARGFAVEPGVGAQMGQGDKGALAVGTGKQLSVLELYESILVNHHIFRFYTNTSTCNQPL